MSGRERRRVIDAVADHQDATACGRQRGHGRDLLGRLHAGAPLRDAERLCGQCHRLDAIARHDVQIEAALRKRAYRCGGVRPQLLAHRGQHAVRQQLRPDAAATIRALSQRGFDLHVMSGDRVEAVALAAQALGITQWRASMKPAEKIAAVTALAAAGRRVLMVGDGINDAPALASAHVSRSPISAAHIAQAQADAVFLGDRLAPVVDAVCISAHARALMRQNLWLAVIYNAVAVPVAIAGLATPLIAAIAMSGSSLLVTLNALRAARPRASAPAPDVVAPTGSPIARPA